MESKVDRRNWKLVMWLLVLLALLGSAGLAGKVRAEAEQSYSFQFINPHSGETVAGMVSVVVLVPLDEQGQPYKDVRLSIDGSRWQLMEYKGNGRYMTEWDTTGYANGWHELRARVVDWSEPPSAMLTYVWVNVCQRWQPCPTE